MVELCWILLPSADAERSISNDLVMSGEKIGNVFKNKVVTFWFRLLLASCYFWLSFFFPVA